MEITNSRILITGGSSGIGKETAKQFIQKGAKVIITGRNETKLNTIADEIGAIPLLFDISDLNAIKEMSEKAISLLGGRIDVLINNAWYGSYGAIEDVPIEEAKRQFEVNIFGLARLTQLVLPYMRKNNFGKIFHLYLIIQR